MASVTVAHNGFLLGPSHNGTYVSHAEQIKALNSNLSILPPSPIRPSNDETQDYGARLVPQVADQLAASSPSKIYAAIPRSSDISDGFRDVTVLELVSAVNDMAWWIEENYGRSDVFATIAYMGVSDIRYAIVFLAAVKCGYKLLVPSMRNSVSMNVSLLKTTECETIFYSEGMEARIKELEDESGTRLRSHQMATLDELLSRPFRPYSYEQDFDEVETKPILVAHTSGSTGSPKPITLTHGAFSVWDAHRKIPKVKGRKNQDYALWNFDRGGRFYSSYPPFHLAGFVTMVFLPIMYPCTVVLGPPERPATGEMVCQIMRHFPLRAVSCAPSILEQMVQEEGGLNMCSQMDFVIYTGGPLAPSAGDALSRVTDVCQLYGSTETGVIPALVPRRDDWAYFEFQPSYKHEMEMVGDDEYEMVIPRDMNLKWMRGICHTFPEVDEWRTRDIFKPHPTKKDLWCFQGRSDDIMVLGNGEKFNPVPMEALIQGHPAVGGALIVGQGRFQAALLVEPKADASQDTEAFIDLIWDFISHANREGPAHAKIVRPLVAAVEPSKYFKRAGKGTVIRGQTTKACGEIIDKLYSDFESKAAKDVPQLPLPFDEAAVLPYVRMLMNMLFPELVLSDTDDFFNCGLDSLQTIELVNTLRAGLQLYSDDSDKAWLAIKTIYSKPSILKLSEAISSHLRGQINGDPDYENVENSRIADMKEMVRKYTSDLPDLLAVRRTKVSKIHVVLTGSTGSLGTHILEALMNDSKVGQITCLNRSADARERHARKFASGGLGSKYNLQRPEVFFDASGILGYSDVASKVSFLQVDFGHPQLGMPEPDWTELSSDVDVIIHNAWKVDFNHSLNSFEDTHIRGVRNFINASINSPKHPSIMFISSISSVGGWPARSVVPETPHQDYNAASRLGYGESKHVAERILSIAAERSAVPSSILRVGQIAGPLRKDGGLWNKTEWFPSLVKTSLSLGLFPETLAPIDWIPVDELAKVIVDIMHARLYSNDSEVFNLVNPTLSSWDALLEPLMSWAGPEARVVPLKKWVATVKQLGAHNIEETSARPALKIIDFFEGITAADQSAAATYRTEHGRAASKTMSRLPAVKAEWMRIWLEQWKF